MSVWLVDGILALTVLEAIGAVLYRRLTGRGPGSLAFLTTLAAGACLLLALRCTMIEAWWPWTAACLLGSLVAHLADVSGRWR